MLKIFAQIDHDRSGMIERGELEAFMKTQGRHMENFKSLDWNDDGKMDKREFFQWHARRAERGLEPRSNRRRFGRCLDGPPALVEPLTRRTTRASISFAYAHVEVEPSRPRYTQSTHEEATAIFKRYAALFEWEYASGEHKPLAEQSEEDIRRILVLFSLFDKDKTGEIDATELSNLAAVLGGSDLKEICREEHVTAEVAEVDSMRLKELKQLIEKHKQTLLYNVTADPREATDLAARRPGDAAALLAKLEAYGAAAVPCWGGTGPTPNPANFSGDCDAHPARSCESPAVYAPGWCGSHKT